VRAAVVDGVGLIAVGEQTQGVAADADDEPACGAQLVERRGTEETFGSNGGHGFLLRHQ
jgi:hypothetical protein